MPKVEFCARIAEVNSMRRARFAKRCLDNLPRSSPLDIIPLCFLTKSDSVFTIISFAKVSADHNVPVDMVGWSLVQIGIVGRELRL